MPSGVASIPGQFGEGAALRFLFDGDFQHACMIFPLCILDMVKTYAANAMHQVELTELMHENTGYTLPSRWRFFVRSAADTSESDIYLFTCVYTYIYIYVCMSYLHLSYSMLLC